MADADAERAARIQADLADINRSLEVLRSGEFKAPLHSCRDAINRFRAYFRANPEMLRAFMREPDNADLMLEFAKNDGVNLALPYRVARALISEASLQIRITQRRGLANRRVSPETQERIKMRDKDLAVAVPKKTARHREIAAELGIAESTVRKYLRR